MTRLDRPVTRPWNIRRIMADYQERIAGEWHERSAELADWVMAHLVNRTDVWGRYVRRRGQEDEAGTGVITAPFRDERGKVFLDTDSLKKHFKVRSGVGVLGVHSTSADQTSRWFAIDIDRHDEDDLSVTSEGNFAAGRAWHHVLAEQGFDPLLLDSNGTGGFHLLVLFAQPMATKSIHEFAKRLTSDYLKRGLSQAPEVFPGAPCWDHYGDWLRLPGRHHTRNHYTRVWNDEPWTDLPWLEGSYRVVIHSSRCRTIEGRNAIAHWLAKHGIEVDEICEHKPPAVVYFDDRAVPFRGDWDQVLMDINLFRR